MDSQELRRLRLGAGLTQVEAAGVLKMSPNMYARYERGEKEIGDELAGRSVRIFNGLKAPVKGAQLKGSAVHLALGEAVLMLTEEQRDALYRRTQRDMVAEAAARAAMSRVSGTLVEELEKTKRDLRHAQDEISHIKSALGA